MNALEKAWYRQRSWALVLLPLSWLFRLVVGFRRRRLRRKNATPLRAPVIIVGNITVGGTGKTPLIIALVKALQDAGLKPGVISRGYGGNAPEYPFLVVPTSDPRHCGDEPLLVSQSCHCPVVVDPDRHNAAVHLLASSNCNIILSDDGMQHYRLHRDLEIVVVDGERGLGNGQCLPAGPLREPASRLYEAQYLIVNGGRSRLAHPNCFQMVLKPLGFRHLGDGRTLPAAEPPGDGAVHAVAGIGNPTRFARTLASLGLSVQLHPFPDHHQFTPEDLIFSDDRPVIITAKDAVKCHHFPQKPGKAQSVWVLDVTAQVEANGLQKLVTHIKQLAEQHQA